MLNIEALNAALMASNLGFRVFPADPATKRPLIKDWPKLATRDLEQIKRYWTQHKNSMVAAVSGEPWLIIDIDIKGTECAFKKLKAFEALHGERIIPAFCIKTPSGGIHLYMKPPEGIKFKNSASKIAAGIDVRFSGG